MCDHCGCRAFPAIAELTAEHEAILGLAETLADATRHHRAIDVDARDRLIAVLRTHVAKEEAGLYPLLIAEMDEDADAFDHLELEHRELFDAIDADAFDHLALYALQRHIEEEEEVLFSGALFHFDGDTWDDLDAVHREVDRSVLAAPGVPVDSELERTKTALEITGKVHALLEQLSESAAPETKPKP